METDLNLTAQEAEPVYAVDAYEHTQEQWELHTHAPTLFDDPCAVEEE
jgi:hypothetical protein